MVLMSLEVTRNEHDSEDIASFDRKQLKFRKNMRVWKLHNGSKLS
jgi:hypothetical protein